jgi:hypothetical protein
MTLAANVRAVPKRANLEPRKLKINTANMAQKIHTPIGTGLESVSIYTSGCG